jgi:8-oxo-dGTP pyrophosphatase MutT (NUDIX family)
MRALMTGRFRSYNSCVIDPAILAAVDRRLARALTGPLPACALIVDGERYGCFDAARCRRLAAFDDVFERTGDHLGFRASLATAAARTEAMERVARTLADEGALTAWRDERYAVRSKFDAPVKFLLERAAARYLGIHTWAAHANGLVAGARGAAPGMWIARRSATKAIDPGMLDNLVGGGIAAGEDPAQALVREAWEEAGIDADRAARAEPAGTLHIERVVPDGVQRETLFAYDLWLPQDFVPANRDGEAGGHRLLAWNAVAAVMSAEAGPDVMTVDATLVALDCLRRHAR